MVLQCPLGGPARCRQPAPPLHLRTPFPYKTNEKSTFLGLVQVGFGSWSGLVLVLVWSWSWSGPGLVLAWSWSVHISWLLWTYAENFVEIHQDLTEI